MIEITGKVGSISREDGGSALIADLDDMKVTGADEAFFVRLQSWSEAKPPAHDTMDSLRGKRVRITVEVL